MKVISFAVITNLQKTFRYMRNPIFNFTRRTFITGQTVKPGQKTGVGIEKTVECNRSHRRQKNIPTSDCSPDMSNVIIILWCIIGNLAGETNFRQSVSVMVLRECIPVKHSADMR